MESGIMYVTAGCEALKLSKFDGIGPKEDILSSDNMLIEWAVIEAVKQCYKFVEYVFQSVNKLTIHKVIVKVRHSFVIENW